MIASGKAQKQAARAKRLSAALRENLKRRKAQARGRSATASTEAAAQETLLKGPEFRRNPGRE
jgi:hypothetical protein